MLLEQLGQLGKEVGGRLTADPATFTESVANPSHQSDDNVPLRRGRSEDKPLVLPGYGHSRTRASYRVKFLRSREQVPDQISARTGPRLTDKQGISLSGAGHPCVELTSDVGQRCGDLATNSQGHICEFLCELILKSDDLSIQYSSLNQIQRDKEHHGGGKIEPQATPEGVAGYGGK